MRLSLLTVLSLVTLTSVHAEHTGIATILATGIVGQTTHAPAEGPVTPEQAGALYENLEKFFSDPKDQTIYYPKLIRDRYAGFKCASQKTGFAGLLLQVPSSTPNPQPSFVFKTYPKKLALDALEKRTAEAFAELMATGTLGGEQQQAMQLKTFDERLAAVNLRIALLEAMQSEGLLKEGTTIAARKAFLRGKGKALADQVFGLNRRFLVSNQSYGDSTVTLKLQLYQAPAELLEAWSEEKHILDSERKAMLDAGNRVAAKMKFEEQAYEDLFGKPPRAENLAAGTVVLKPTSPLIFTGPPARMQAQLFAGKDAKGRVVQKMQAFASLKHHETGFLYSVARTDEKGEPVTGADGKIQYDEFRCW